MQIIGLTGGIASGKTEVAKIFKRHGIYVINSDEIGHYFLANSEIKEKIISIYGESILKDGKIDRDKLGRIVFSKPEERKRINELIHPLVIADIMNRIQQAQQQGQNIVVIESALIGEDNNRLLEWFNGIILVICPEEIRIQRLMNLRKLSYEDARLRIQSQRIPEEKQFIAQWVIHNDGNLLKLEEETEKIIKEISNVA
ncbi:MAG: dephospho-CoA kinase [Candidatus Hydrogenedens sp.]